MQLPKWSTACPDWETRIVKKQSLIPFPPLFPQEAEDALNVMKQLRMVDVAGSPTIDECCAPWTLDFSGSVFGAYDVETGIRHIKEFFLLIAKKNSKSSLGGLLMLTVLIRNWRPSAEFLILAPTLEVANNSFKPIADSIRADDELMDLLLIQDHLKTITHRRTNATLKVVAADANTVGGKKAAGILIDELWLFGKMPNAMNMLVEATGGLASRPEGFVIYLTTQSDQAPAGVFKDKLQYARDVRDGKIVDPAFLPILYEFPKHILDAKENRNPKNFYMTNPNMGYSVDETFLIRELKKAENTGEAALLSFLSKHTNLEIGLALRSDRWAGADFWESTEDKKVTFEYILENSEVIGIGIDGGGLDDLLALALIGRCKTTKNWLTWSKAWAHPSVLERRKSEVSVFEDFEKDGDLIFVERAGDDIEQLVDIVEQVYVAGLLYKIGLDPAGIGAILDALEERGIPKEKLEGISQGWRLGGAIKTVERKLAEGTLRHAAQKLVTWSVGNAKIEPRANSILITKQASGTAKIDPVMALVDAGYLMAQNPPAASGEFRMFFL